MIFKRKTLIYLSIILICAAIIVPDFINRGKNLVPSHSFSLTTITDQPDQGNSNISLYETDKGQISFKFKLNKGYTFPYAGIRLKSAKDYLFKTTNHDLLRIVANSDSACTIMINIITDVPIYDSKNGLYHRRAVYFSTMAKIEEGYNTINTALSDFQIPEWWFTKNRIERSKAKNIRLKAFGNMEILVNSNNQSQQGNIVVKSISLEKKILNLLITNFIKLFSITFFIVILVYFVKLRATFKKAKQTVLTHKKIHLDNEKERIKANIVNFLDQNYSDPDLNISYMSKKTNISIYLIPSLLKEISDCTFKQYVNNLRVNKAKDMLKNEDTKIIDVAYSVGYNTVTHFNKVFKSLEGISPKDYRKKYQSIKPEYSEQQ